MEEILLIKRSFTLSLIILLVFTLFTGCSTKEDSYLETTEKSHLDYVYDSVKLFIRTKDKNLSVIKDEENDLITIIDNSIAEQFINHQILAIKLNGYKEIKYKWDQDNSYLIDSIENYKNAMDHLGYKINFVLLRGNNETSYAINGKVIYDKLFKSIYS